MDLVHHSGARSRDRNRAGRAFCGHGHGACPDRALPFLFRRDRRVSGNGDRACVGYSRLGGNDVHLCEAQENRPQTGLCHAGMHPHDVYGRELCGFPCRECRIGQLYAFSDLLHRYSLSGKARHQQGEYCRQGREAGCKGNSDLAVLRTDHRFRDRLRRNGRRHDDAGGVYCISRNGAQNGGRYQHFHHDFYGADRLGQSYPDPSGHPAGKVECDASVYHCRNSGESVLGKICQPGK